MCRPWALVYILSLSNPTLLINDIFLNFSKGCDDTKNRNKFGKKLEQPDLRLEVLDIYL